MTITTTLESNLVFYGKYENAFSESNLIKLGMSLENLNGKLQKQFKEFKDIIHLIPRILSCNPKWNVDHLTWEYSENGIKLIATSIADLTYKFEIVNNISK